MVHSFHNSEALWLIETMISSIDDIVLGFADDSTTTSTSPTTANNNYSIKKNTSCSTVNDTLIVRVFLDSTSGLDDFGRYTIKTKVSLNNSITHNNNRRPRKRVALSTIKDDTDNTDEHTSSKASSSGWRSKLNLFSAMAPNTSTNATNANNNNSSRTRIKASTCTSAHGLELQYAAPVRSSSNKNKSNDTNDNTNDNDNDNDDKSLFQELRIPIAFSSLLSLYYEEASSSSSDDDSNNNNVLTRMAQMRSKLFKGNTCSSSSSSSSSMNSDTKPTTTTIATESPMLDEDSIGLCVNND